MTPQQISLGGQLWTIERRHEMTQLMTHKALRERKLYLFFYGPGNELRRTEIPEDFPIDPSMSKLESAWTNAETLRPASLGEMQSQAGLAIPPFVKLVTHMWRAIRLRCPNCGKGRVLKSWFTLRTTCSHCGLRFERGESQDYFLGGMMFNIILAELLFVVGFGIALFIMWPNVPWNGLEYILAAIAIIGPIVLYPVSRVIWLAFDLLFRPLTPEEMQWHKANPESGNAPRS